MSLEIFEGEQGTEEWHAFRLGLPTASCFSDVMASGKGGAESQTRTTYMEKLIGERLSGQPMWSYQNEHTERGHEMEDEARRLYAMVADIEPQKVGCMRRIDLGAAASPDSLVGDNGLLEIKTKLPHLQVKALRRLKKFQGNRRVPPEHMDQLQGQLLISGRRWVDFVSYWPGMPLFLVRVTRDEEAIAQLETGIRAFNAELALVLESIR